MLFDLFSNPGAKLGCFPETDFTIQFIELHYLFKMYFRPFFLYYK